MRVLFDAYWWIEGPAAVRRVMRQIIDAWQEEFKDDEIGIVVRYRHRHLVGQSIDPRVKIFTSHMRPQAFLATIGISFAARRFKPDVVLTHNFAMPGSRSVVYLHDLMFKTNPEWFTRSELAYFAAMAPLARRADVVFTSSESEARRIRRFVSSPSIVPVGIGISEALLDADPVSPARNLRPRGYLLAVGRLNARKNLGRVVSAAVQSNLLTVDFPMVVAGEADGAAADLPIEAQQAEKDGRLIFLGFVTDGELHWLYSNARATTYVSLDEGYGMPPLESLALGTPVIASDIPVMRENLGDMAGYADPHDIDAIEDAIRSELATPLDEERVERLTRHGRSCTWPMVVHRIRSRSLEISNG